MNETAKKWKDTAAETFYGKSEGLSFFGMGKEDFARDQQSAVDWLDGLLKVWTDGEKESDEIVSAWKMCIRDRMIRWFCILFGNQFTPDDVLDYYPVDRLMHDIALALMAVQTQTTSILDEFPTKAAQAEKGAEQPQTQTA